MAFVTLKTAAAIMVIGHVLNILARGINEESIRSLDMMMSITKDSSG